MDNTETQTTTLTKSQPKTQTATLTKLQNSGQDPKMDTKSHIGKKEEIIF